jgi:DNA-binding MarR family transcriptional regulator
MSETLMYVTPMMRSALRVLVKSNRAIVKRHADLTLDEIPVRTATSLERRGWVQRVHGGSDGRQTFVEITAQGSVIADVLFDTDDSAQPVLTPAQVEHTNRALRYLSEAKVALTWAKLPIPELDAAREHPWMLHLLKGERAANEATQKLKSGLDGFLGEGTDGE